MCPVDAFTLATGAWLAWIALDNGRYGGTTWLRFLEKVPNPVVEAEVHGYVSNVYVVPSLRGKGVGSQLMTAMINECIRVGVHAAFLWPSERSRSLYVRFGFEDCGPVMVRTWDDGSHAASHDAHEVDVPLRHSDSVFGLSAN
jgi:GNAT superfamily N-acetyltransferase